ncbi:MAG TPA: hypothetical protein VFE78_16940, partial [Gemmataceae bacterium]|nr:hypothetical protein [Gemmataceae bacterium]
VCAALRRSLRYGLRHRDDALAWASRFGRGAGGQCTGRFVEMFANADSLRMPADVRQALRVLFGQLVGLGLAPAVPSLHVIEGAPLARPAA